jgi:hypothetical protein
MLVVKDIVYFCEEFIHHLMENVPINDIMLMLYKEGASFEDLQDMRKYKMSRLEWKESIREAFRRLHKN